MSNPHPPASAFPMLVPRPDFNFIFETTLTNLFQISHGQSSIKHCVSKSLASFLSKLVVEILKMKNKAGERAQWSRAHTALAEDLSSVPSTSAGQLTTALSFSTRGSEALSVLQWCLCSCAQIYTQICTYTHTGLKSFF